MILQYTLLLTNLRKIAFMLQIRFERIVDQKGSFESSGLFGYPSVLDFSTFDVVALHK
jgi:hypothetical protein